MIFFGYRASIKVVRSHNFRKCISLSYDTGVRWRAFHQNARALHHFKFEYSDNELIAELRRLSVTNDSIAATTQKYDDLESIKTLTDAMQLINYLLYTSKVEVSRPKHLHADDPYFEHLLSQFECFIPMLRPTELVSAAIALHLANVPLYHPVNRSLTISISRSLRG